ncbi:response regulator [Paracoccus cavernae]|uniref:histidine kinase n=1 Tax=Paracoccus cavernae TaxID=1571207 RepID=A0ABT8DC53_9RHOB|nr:response regulator [Paracoccus cavernae]
MAGPDPRQRPGIDTADQALIFREFHRLDSKAAAGEGLGLGLAIVERAAGQLGHRIGLRSALGCGSTFSVSMTSAEGLLPARTPPAPQTRTAGPDEEQSGQTVLLVENDAELARATTELLERWGLTVLGVASGEEALDLIAETGVEPDLCLVDYQLGAGMDGIACLNALRMRFGRDLPARLVTADRSAELGERAREYGIEILQKPVAPRLLGPSSSARNEQRAAQALCPISAHGSARQPPIAPDGGHCRAHTGKNAPLIEQYHAATGTERRVRSSWNAAIPLTT